MSELVKCPHCGEEAKVISIGGSWKAVCSACDASSGLCATEGDAIAAWNHRTKPECPPLQWNNQSATINGYGVGYAGSYGNWSFYLGRHTQHFINPDVGQKMEDIPMDKTVAAVEAAWLEFWNKIHGVGK